MAHHKVKNGKLVPASRFQVLVDSFYVKNEPTIIRVLDRITRFFIRLKAKPVLMVLSRLMGLILPTGEVVTTERAVSFIDAISVLEKTEITVGPCMCQKALNKRSGTYMKDLAILHGADSHKMACPEEYGDVSPDEAKRLMRQCEKEGLVPTFYSCLRSGGWMYAICNCESEICFPFRAHKAAGAVVHRGPDVVSLSQDDCTGCGMCVERCHFGANALVNGTSEVNLAKCYGCGLCVSTCAGHARKMVNRTGYTRRYYPVDLVGKVPA